MNAIACLAGLAAAVPLFAAGQTPVPKLIVVISVDQFSADLFAEYRPSYTAGLKRLSTGTVFPSGYQSHAVTETCPGHSTILTGAHPSRTGIVANDWIDQSPDRAGKQVYCAEDPRAPRPSPGTRVVSAIQLKVPTLGDWLKAAHPQSRVISVAGKDRAAIMLGGHSIDQAWFWDGKAYVSLPDRTGPVPVVVAQVNAAVSRSIARPSPVTLPAACRARSAVLAAGATSVGTLVNRKPGDYDAFPTSLDFDRATTDIAIGLIQELKPGAGAAPDVVAVGLSGTDYVGHAYGVEGAEMCAQVLDVDRNIGRLLEAVDGLHVPYLVVLTADHGGHDLPERNQRRAFPAATRVDPELTAAKIGQRLALEFGLPEPVLSSLAPGGDIYLRSDIPAGLRPRVIEAARAAYAGHPQVAAVYTATELRRLAAPTGAADEWSLAERIRASYDPDRSGDLFVVLKAQVTAISRAQPGYVATHGSPWNYDRRVPVVFYRPGMTGFEQPLPVETVDILPTLAAQIGLPLEPTAIDGRCLEIFPVAAPSCPARDR